MNAHREVEYLETLAEMKARRKRWRVSDNDSESAEDIFVDEFRNGEYHEEEPDWQGIAEALSKKNLCDAALVIIHWLAAGGEIEPGTDELKTTMRFHEALRKWATGGQTDPGEIVGELEEMRTLLRAVAKSEAAAGRGASQGETLRLFQFIYLGVRGGLGIGASLDIRLGDDDFIRNLYDPR